MALGQEGVRGGTSEAAARHRATATEQPPHKAAHLVCELRLELSNGASGLVDLPEGLRHLPGMQVGHEELF